MANSSMKDLAKAFRRAGVPVKRGQPKRKLIDVLQEGTGDNLDSPPVFGEALDSWEPRYRPETEAQIKQPVQRKELEKVPEIAELEPDSDFVEETRTAQRMKRNKTRNMSLTVSVSEEEHQLLRRHAASLGLGFSSWARDTLFRAMGRKPPARPKRD